MKLDNLKELVKEELKRALNKVKVKIDYITEDPEEGGPLMDGFTTKQIDQAEKRNSRHQELRRLGELSTKEQGAKIGDVPLDRRSYERSLGCYSHRPRCTLGP